MKNGVMMQYFEWNLPNDGKLWVHLKEDAKHLHDIGITSVWIPPAYKADEQQDEGYAVYDLYDLGEFDQKGTVRTKYGTRHELEEAVAALHENGIAVYLDTVMNQKTGADYTEKFMACEVDPENREQVIGAPVEVEGWTGYSFPGARRQIFSLQMALVPLLGNRPGLRDRQTGHLPHPGRRQEVERRRRRRERELRFPDLQRRGLRPSRGGRRNETLGRMDRPNARRGRHAPRRAQTHQECLHRRLHAQRPGFAGQRVLRRR